MLISRDFETNSSWNEVMRESEQFPKPDPVSLALPEVCDGSQGADKGDRSN